MNPKPDLAVPLVHLNGTSRAELLEGYSDAVRALHHAGRALAKAAPNARDYYPLGPGAFAKAADQHEARMAKLREVINELEAVAMAIE